MLKIETNRFVAAARAAQAADAVLQQMATLYGQLAKLSSERLGVELQHLGAESASDVGVELKRRSTALKHKQQQLRERVLQPLRERLDGRLRAEQQQLRQLVYLQDDGPQRRVETYGTMTAKMVEAPKVLKPFDVDQWLQLFRSQPWMSKEAAEEQRQLEQRRELREQLERKRGVLAFQQQQRQKADKKRQDIEAALDAKTLQLQSDAVAPADKFQLRRELQEQQEALSDLRDAIARQDRALAKQTQEADQLDEALAAEERKAEERRQKFLSAQTLFEQQELREESDELAALEQSMSAAQQRHSRLTQQLRSQSVGATADLRGRLRDAQLEIQHLRGAFQVIEKRKQRRVRLQQEALAAHRAEERLDRLRELQTLLRERRSVVVQEILRRNRELEEERRRAEAERRREEEQRVAARRADEAIAELGLLERARRQRRFTTAVKRMLRGEAATDAEAAQMKLAVQRRMKVKTGRPVALRRLRFSVGQEETAALEGESARLRAEGLPHFERLAKSIGSHVPIHLWFEKTIDPDDFLTDIRLCHSDPAHARYAALESQGYSAVSHERLRGAEPRDPKFILWVRRDAQAVQAISDVDVSFSQRDEEELRLAGFEPLADGDMAPFGFSEMSMWVRREARSALPSVESSQVVARELTEARKLLKQKPNDAALLGIERRLQHKLAKALAQEDDARRHDDNPLKYSLEVFAFSRDDLEAMMLCFMKMDDERIGCVVRRHHDTSTLLSHLCRRRFAP
eukprot:scaffold1397_cov254-Pinguiococcus_pyrenoidosus.AAC.62